MDMEVDEEEEGGESMYVFEGMDYSKEPSTDDIKFFDQMLEGMCGTSVAL